MDLELVPRKLLERCAAHDGRQPLIIDVLKVERRLDHAQDAIVAADLDLRLHARVVIIAKREARVGQVARVLVQALGVGRAERRGARLLRRVVRVAVRQHQDATALQERVALIGIRAQREQVVVLLADVEHLADDLLRLERARLDLEALLVLGGHQELLVGDELVADLLHQPRVLDRKRQRRVGDRALRVRLEADALHVLLGDGVGVAHVVGLRRQRQHHAAILRPARLVVGQADVVEPVAQLARLPRRHRVVHVEHEVQRRLLREDGGVEHLPDLGLALLPDGHQRWQPQGLLQNLGPLLAELDQQPVEGPRFAALAQAESVEDEVGVLMVALEPALARLDLLLLARHLLHPRLALGRGGLLRRVEGRRRHAAPSHLRFETRRAGRCRALGAAGLAATATAEAAEAAATTAASPTASPTASLATSLSVPLRRLRCLSVLLLFGLRSASGIVRGCIALLRNFEADVIRRAICSGPRDAIARRKFALKARPTQIRVTGVAGRTICCHLARR
jgi:hypothetical protein